MQAVIFARHKAKQKGKEYMNKQATHPPMEKLRAAREAAHLTQDELAAKTGICKMSIYYYEAGVRSPSIKTLRKISRALGVSVGEIVEV